jgi:hypothetical protein
MVGFSLRTPGLVFSDPGLSGGPGSERPPSARPSCPVRADGSGAAAARGDALEGSSERDIPIVGLGPRLWQGRDFSRRDDRRQGQDEDPARTPFAGFLHRVAATALSL